MPPSAWIDQAEATPSGCVACSRGARGRTSVQPPARLHTSDDALHEPDREHNKYQKDDQDNGPFVVSCLGEREEEEKIDDQQERGENERHEKLESAPSQEF